MSKKAEREQNKQLAYTLTEQHVYSDELLDYFLLVRSTNMDSKPSKLPANFQPDLFVDSDEHTALHWASAPGNIEVIKQLKSFGANMACQNIRGETPLMRAVHYTNCLHAQGMPESLKS